MGLGCSSDFVLDERQQRIFDALDGRHADLAAMYRVAVQMLAAGPEEGDGRMRVAHICHAMREVMNRFVDAMDADVAQRIKPPSGDQVGELPDLLAAHPDLVLDQQDQDLVPVPAAVAAAFDKLIKTAVQEGVRSRDIAAALLTDDGDSGHPAVNQWMAARKFFVKWAHLHARAADPQDVPHDSSMAEHVRVVEDLILSVTSLFFDARREIDDLLGEINETNWGAA